MGPLKAAKHFLAHNNDPRPDFIEVELYGSLAATGKGHLTDVVLHKGLQHVEHKITWFPDEMLPYHSCGMYFNSFKEGKKLERVCYYSVGGGNIADIDGNLIDAVDLDYEHDAMSDVLKWCEQNNCDIWEYALSREPETCRDFLNEVLESMYAAVKRGLDNTQVLPGGLNIKRRARKMRQNASRYKSGMFYDMTMLGAYALAVSEENASGNVVVTAPTCGACGVVPAVLYFMEHNNQVPRCDIVEALATAGIFGSSIAARASISGAEVGCQGEVGSGCAMAAAAAAYILGGTNKQVEYAAEMAMEHMLGLTCDPVAGLVQVPCIERNAFAAMRAIECASYALSTSGDHFISFDDVVEVMNKTGRDLQCKYRETSRGGLAELIHRRMLDQAR